MVLSIFSIHQGLSLVQILMYVEVKISPCVKKYTYEGLRKIILEMGERLHE